MQPILFRCRIFTSIRVDELTRSPIFDESVYTLSAYNHGLNSDFYLISSPYLVIDDEDDDGDDEELQFEMPPALNQVPKLGKPGSCIYLQAWMKPLEQRVVNGFRVDQCLGLGYVSNNIDDQASQYEIEILGQAQPDTLVEQAFYDPLNDRLRH